MKLYVAICQDRHADVDIAVFDTPEKAIQYAKDFVEENSNPAVLALVPEDERHEDIPEWLYNDHYSNEGDGVHVIEVLLNNEEAP